MITGIRNIKNEKSKIYINNINVGKYYYDFFEKNLKKYNYIRKQDGFNMACCKLDDDNELYCLRYLGTIKAYFGEEIIPGNFSNIPINYSNKYSNSNDRNIKIGKNFFWNNWKDLIDNTIFFVGSFKNNILKINENIKPFVIHNKYALTNINEKTLKYTDVRLFKIKNDIYCYDGLITSIYQIKIILDLFLWKN